MKSIVWPEKTVWITGASSGIGAALAIELAERGARLVLSARNTERLEQTKGKCRNAGQIWLAPFDQSRFGTHPTLVENVIAMSGGIDILVHNAGISQRALARDTRFEVDRRIIEVDLLGPISLTKAILPHFLERGAGHFVVVSSLVGKFESPMRSAYSAAKHGLHGFFDSLRAELHGAGIEVTILCPGFVHTQVSVNALTGDGTPLGQMDQATRKGLTATAFARKAVRAIEARRAEAYFGGREVWGVYLKRYFPALFRRLIRTARVT